MWFPCLIYTVVDKNSNEEDLYMTKTSGNLCYSVCKHVYKS